MPERIVRIEVDPRVPEGEVAVGGVWIADAQDDAAAGRALRTRIARCHDRSAAERLRDELSECEVEIVDEPCSS